MLEKKSDKLALFGFRVGRGGVHTSRTMMLGELSLLLDYVDTEDADKCDYVHAIEIDNCLGKRSGKTRKLTVRHLVDLYSLDQSVLLFRSLRYLWKRDLEGHPLLALLCAYARDEVLRMSAPFILEIDRSRPVEREALEVFIEKKDPGRFSEATLKSTAQNINSTWTKSGHVRGHVRKIRSRANSTPGAVAYALFLGYLRGARGVSLFETEYAKLLDCPMERAVELAEEASRRGWIVFKRIGTVVEALFPNLITSEEAEWIREPD